jgi:hypothetical protein
MEVKEVKKQFELPRKKVRIVPIKRPTAFIPDETHQASFLAPRAKNVFVMPYLRNGQMMNILTDEEKEFFEDSERSHLHFKSGDLSVHKKVDNYWSDFTVELGKDVETLDLSNPMDYFKYKFLTKLPQIANSKEESKRKATYKYYLIDEDEEIIMEAEEASLEEEFWSLVSEVKKDRIKMINILTLFGKKVSDNSSDNFLLTELRKIGKRSKESMKTFIDTVNDPNFDIKIFIDKAVNVRAISRQGNQYFLDGERIASSTDQLIKYLQEGENQDQYMLIEDRINNAK